MKGGAALEQLASGEILLFDETGTITGRQAARRWDILTTADMTTDDVLRSAASLDQVTPHVLAAAVVRAARARGLAVSLPEDVEEVPGYGVRGRVDGHRVAFGKASWTSAESRPPGRAGSNDAPRSTGRSPSSSTSTARPSVRCSSTTRSGLMQHA
jgi:cation transport ATPase